MPSGPKAAEQFFSRPEVAEQQKIPSGPEVAKGNTLDYIVTRGKIFDVNQLVNG
jgi:hypothetical protein